MTLSEAQIRDLVERARQGNDRAVDSLIGGLRERMLRWALVVTADVDDAEDVTQQVSLKLHKELSRFESRSQFTTWLYTVVRNTALDSLRRRRPLDIDAATAIPVSTEDALQKLHDKIQAERLRNFFAELPTRQRELIELIDQQGLNAVEAAQALGIDASTARVHLMKARRALRARMLEQTK